MSKQFLRGGDRVGMDNLLLNVPLGYPVDKLWCRAQNEKKQAGRMSYLHQASPSVQLCASLPDRHPFMLFKRNLGFSKLRK